MSVFNAFVLLLTMNFVITQSQSSLRIHSAIASWIHGYFDNVMTKFIVNDRTNASITEVNLFFTITNYQIVRSRSLPHRINYKFMCLAAH